MSEIPFHHVDDDGSRYELDVILDRRDEANPHYDVDLVRAQTGHFGEGIEQRLTLAEYDDRNHAEQHRRTMEDTITDQGLNGLGEAVEQVREAPVLYDGKYLFVSYPPDADPDDPARAHLLRVNENGVQTQPIAVGTADEMLRVVETGDLALAGGEPLMQPQADYYFGYGVGPNDLPALEAVKTWQADGERRFDTLTIGEYGTFDEAAIDERELENLLENEGLEPALNLAETMAETGGYLDPERDDPRLFFEDGAPDDSFTTNREAEIDDQLAREGVTWRETQAWEAETADIVENPHWRLDALPVNDPNGEPLGQAVHMVVYDGVERTDAGSPAIPEDESFRMLEVADFETTEAADKFGKEFNGYIMPGLLDGPELAEEVARLEGHPVEWKTLDGQELDDYRDLKLTLTRDRADWQPYNPNAERDARIEAEGLDPIQVHVNKNFSCDDGELPNGEINI